MTNLKIVELENADFITHNGFFHADEVFGTVLLCKVFDEVNLCRAKNINASRFSDSIIIYDTGNSKFDHHENPKNRPNGNPYSSFGLLWKEYGRKYINEKIGITDSKKVNTIFNIFDRFVTGIDVIDCIGSRSQKVSDSYNIYNISDIISTFNKRWDEEDTEDEVVQNSNFIKAVYFAETVFDNIMKNTISNIIAKDELENAIEKSNGRILILEKFIPWQTNIFFSRNAKSKQILFVIFPSLRGGFNCQTVPIEFRSRTQKVLFPSEWAGKTKKELANITGIKTATFCHLERFICGAETLEDTIQLAVLALKNLK